MTPVEAGHDYVRRGWSVVPLYGIKDNGVCRCRAGVACTSKSPGKHPSTGNDWQDRVLTSGADVEAWYEDHPHDNIGIATGPRRGLWVLDIDGPAGINSVMALTAANGPLPSTRIIRTGSGGLHYYFRHPGHFIVYNSSSWLGPGIDVRGNNGQVVAPPSVSGRGSYELIADHPLIDAPDWLLELVKEHSEHIEAGRKAEVVPAARVDREFLPPRVQDLISTLIGIDEGRFRHFHAIVAACYEAGYSQGQAVTIAAPWCAAVNKFVGRVEQEVARCWGKLQAEAQRANDWVDGIAGPDPTAPKPTPPTTDGTAALNPAPDDPAGADYDEPEDTPALTDLPATWKPIDLVPILTGTYQPEIPDLLPRTDKTCLLYAGRVHSLHGESESGKSLVAQAETARLIADASDVLYIDFESDAPAVVGRLLELGAPPGLVQSHLTYLRPDNDPRKFAHEREAFSELLSRPYVLAVVDGVTDALGVFGASSKDNDDIAAFMRSVPRLIANRTGAAVVLVDHVTKDADSRGRFAVGGQAKMNALDGSAFMVEVVESLGRGLRGVITLRIAKDRPGGVRPHCGAFRKTDRSQEAARIIVDSTEAPGERIDVSVEAPFRTVENDSGTAHTFRPTYYMERVSEFLGNAVEPQTDKAIEDAVGGNNKARRQALALLVAEGFVEVETGPRRAKLHTHVKPYLADEDPLSDTYVPTSPETTSPTSPHLAHDLAQKGVSDLAQAPAPPTGQGEVNGGAGRGDLAPTSPTSNDGTQTACRSCYRPIGQATANTTHGLCAACYAETDA